MSQKSTKLKKLSRVEAYTKASSCIQKLYETADGKKFIHHLIYAFSNNRARFILYSKNEIFDCITNSLLETVYTNRRKITDEITNEILSKYKTVNSEEEKLELSKKLNDRTEELLSTMEIERLAVRSEVSDKILGVDELQALTDFIKDQVSKKNSVIIGMIRYAKGELNKNKGKKSLKSVDSRKTLGANDELRAKLEAAING